MLIILIIFSVYIIPENIMDPSENVFQKFKYPICLIIIFIGIYRIYKAGRYSINIMKKNIKILFKNQEISYFNVENIAFVKFSRTENKATFFLLGDLIIGFFRNKEKSGNYPLMQLFDFKGKEFFGITLSIKDYWLMKKYFLKYNVKTEDLCDFLNDELS